MTPTPKIVYVVGARPNFVKMAPVIAALRARLPDAGHVVVHTGQHYDQEMSDIFLDQLGMPEPDHLLGVGSGSHAQQTARVMERLEPVLEGEQPDLVIVPGDVNSTLAAALVAAKLGIPIAHLEAGLRSFDRSMPEEINRIVADEFSDLAPSPFGRSPCEPRPRGDRHGTCAPRREHDDRHARRLREPLPLDARGRLDGARTGLLRARDPAQACARRRPAAGFRDGGAPTALRTGAGRLSGASTHTRAASTASRPERGSHFSTHSATSSSSHSRPMQAPCSPTRAVCRRRRHTSVSRASPSAARPSVR